MRKAAGIILARQQVYPVGELMRRLLRLIAAVPAEEMKDRVEFLNAWVDFNGFRSTIRTTEP